MRDYLHIDLAEKQVRRENFSGEQVARSGRYFIARTLVDSGSATVDPLSDANPLIFSAGPFAGTNFSNANRLSVGLEYPRRSAANYEGGAWYLRGTYSF